MRSWRLYYQFYAAHSSTIIRTKSMFCRGTDTEYCAVILNKSFLYCVQNHDRTVINVARFIKITAAVLRICTVYRQTMGHTGHGSRVILGKGRRDVTLRVSTGIEIQVPAVIFTTHSGPTQSQPFSEFHVQSSCHVRLKRGAII